MSPDATPATPAIEATGLTVRFRRRGEPEICAVNGVGFALARGQVMTILGESGSGKSVSLKAVMGLLPPFAKVEGQVRIGGRDVLSLPPAELAKLRGGQVSMIFQEPMAAMDPVYTIGDQIAETIVQHEGTDRATAMARAKRLLDRVAIPSAARRLKNYPHEMSGGMRQRAMIALALACSPSVLLADEPTTALDVTVQIQILMLLRELQSELGMAVVFVTHDVGVAAEISDRIAVMYAGRFVEAGTVREVMRTPQHPYTRGLLASTVHGGMRRQELRTIPGNPPSLAALPAGCHFRPRCPEAVSRCMEEPPVVSPRPGAMVRCVHAERAARAADAVPA
ncbi:ABC transporter ATP-binding protein [Roseomonas sp. E05]|uniref:ABC transporter ATP-binding protein n=1 Tax=Roseomonas sp. E05 TaxID=3046310 RepID=UPI0024B94F06|nr:ABC transporter ATP-binding protein [Roseomonas sp. E05]MDJ0390468.1 ABC transporter ATP-binding protein [Roseomonas sp. E05]